jgi:predicted molibdopterin-dependent oxidoreductase YjgC
MHESVTLSVDGRMLRVGPGTSVAAAMLIAGVCRTSVSGEPRAPMCGMGTCFECRATVDGVPHERTCQTLCRDGMEVRTRE